MSKKSGNIIALVLVGTLMFVVLVLAPNWGPTGRAFGNGEGCGGEEVSNVVNLPSTVRIATETDGRWDLDAVDSLVAANAPVVQADGPLLDLLNEGYAATGRHLGADVRISVVSREEFDRLQTELGDQLDGARVGGMTVHSDGQRVVVMPADLPVNRFIEVFHHEIGHVREALYGEHEPELAELIQGLALAQLSQTVGASLLDNLFEVPDEERSHEENRMGHLRALAAYIDAGGDTRRAFDALAELDPGLADQRLKELCGCDDLLAPANYTKFRRAFLEVLTRSTAVPGADAKAPQRVADYLALVVQLRISRSLHADGDSDSRQMSVEQAEAFMAAHPGVGAMHREIMRGLTRMYRIQGNEQDRSLSERLALHGKVFDVNGAYPVTSLDEAADSGYLRSYAAAAGLALAIPDAEAIESLSDGFIERFGENPASGLAKEVAAVVFEARGQLEGGREASCVASSWYRRAIAARCEAPPCGSADAALGRADAALAAGDAADCPTE